MCVCVCEPHTLTYLVYGRRLYIAVGKTQADNRLKLAVRVTCLPLAEAETSEMEGTGRKGGIDHAAGSARSLLLFVPPPPPLSTLRHRETLFGGLGWRRGWGAGQAEFTYLSAGSLPDFTADIGGW